MNVEHPKGLALKAYRLGKLDEVEAEQVAAHLVSCAACRRTLDGMSLGGMTVDGLPATPAAMKPPRDPAGTTSGGSGALTTTTDHPRISGVVEAPQIADYELIRHLGGGGMGVVYLYRNTLMGRTEVLKVLAQHLVDNPQAMERFLREIQSAAQLNHRNIVRAYSAIRWNGGLILSMEYVEGQDLADRVEKLGPLAVTEACMSIYQAAKGLQHAALSKMVHRDIKPANLIMDLTREKGLVKILDFGLAKVTSERPVDNGLTRQGFLLGSPDYMAPEQIRNPQAADIRADIYSLGCTLYFLLAGRPPFDGTSLYDILQAHHSTEANPLDLMRPDVPAELAALVAKMMAKDPGHRFQTPAAVAEALLPYCRPGAGSGTRPTPKSGEIAPPVKPERQGTIVETIPLAQPLRRSMPTIVEAASVGIPNRRATMQEALPLRMGPRESVELEFDEEPTPAWKRPAVLAAIGVAVLVVSALAVGLFVVNKGKSKADATQPPPIALTPVPPKTLSVTPTPPTPPKGASAGLVGFPVPPPAKTPATVADVAQPTPTTPRPGERADADLEIQGMMTRNEADSSKTERPEPPPKSENKYGIRPGPGGFVRADYKDVLATPEKYEGMKVIPSDYLRISTTVFQDKRLSDFRTLIVCDRDRAKLTNQFGKPEGKNIGGPWIVLDKDLATEYLNLLTKERIKQNIAPNCKIVARMEVRKSEGRVEGDWLLVIVGMQVLLDEDPDSLIAGNYEAAFDIYASAGGPFRKIRDHGQDWYDRLGGEKEKNRVKHDRDEDIKTARRQQKIAGANAKMQVINRNSLRWAADQEAKTDAIRRNMMNGK